MQGLKVDEVERIVDGFKKDGLFDKPRFEVLQEHFIAKLGHGPEVRQVTLKLPEAAVFFTYAHHQNVTNALNEIE